MKKEFYKEIEIPEGVNVLIEGTLVKITGPEGELERDFDARNLDVKKEGEKIIVGHKKATKKEKKMINTIVAHISNMVKGVQEKFEYVLKVCSSHFPMTVEVKGKEAFVKNFFGEKFPRKVEIPEGAEVEVKKDIITVKSVNKELAGQAAANFERATRAKKRDIRIFQDGIYITNKAGRQI